MSAGTGKTIAKPATPMAALERLTLVLQLQRRARQAEREELPFVMVNETRQLLPYRQAALVTLSGKRSELAALSGLSVPDKSSPYARWLGDFVRWRAAGSDAASLARLDFAALEESHDRPKWLADWREWLPQHGVWVPLADNRGRLLAVLTLFREEPLADADMALLAYLGESYAQSYALSRKRTRRGGRLFSPWLVLIALAVAAMFIPLRQSVLAPAEVTARRPALVRSGLDGVVEQLLVQPNQRVAKGDPLVRLDATQLQTRLAVAKKAEDMAEAEYRQLLQSALSDPRTKQRIPLVMGRMEQLAAETAYIESLIERVVIHSPLDGVALCDNPDEWLGRPVNLGQRIMLVADPADVELEVQLPAADSLELTTGEEIMFFPNVSPIAPMPATLNFIGYRANEMPGVGMAYTLRADLAHSDAPLLGLRGMAKLYGESRPLGLNMFGYPIMTGRQWLGR